MSIREFLLNPNPTATEAEEIVTALAKGEYSPALIGALLATIRTRGATEADITGAAHAFIRAATPITIRTRPVIDCVGTGGDGANTINISTAASLLAAANGLTVVKHGNRSISSKSGAADVLEALGVPLDLSPDEAAEQVEKTGFTFLFAPAYHPAFAHVMPVRRELGIPTIFNILGPLINPATPELQLMGIADPSLGPVIIETLAALGRERALVVHGDGTDEIAIHGPTQIWELADGTINHSVLTPDDLGLHSIAPGRSFSLEDLRGGDGITNARILRASFEGKGSEAHDAAIALNAGALFYLAGINPSIAAGAVHAHELLRSGAVMDWLQHQ